MTAKRLRKRPFSRREAINVERNRRMNGVITFQDHTYEADQFSYDLIRDAHVVASNAIVEGAQPGDFRWSEPDSDFAWRDIAEVWVPMDAMTCVDFAERVISYRGSCVRHGMALKTMNPLPEDYTDDKYWPV